MWALIRYPHIHKTKNHCCWFCFTPNHKFPVKTSNFNCVQLSPKFNHSDKMDSKPFVHHFCIQAKRLRWPLLALQVSSEWEVLVRNWERGWINKRNFVLLYSYSCSMPNDKRTSAAPPVALRCAASSWRKVDQSLDHKRIPWVAQCVHRDARGRLCRGQHDTGRRTHTATCSILLPTADWVHCWVSLTVSVGWHCPLHFSAASWLKKWTRQICC